MNAPTTLKRPKAIVYPDSDGQPIAENTLQFRWIVTIQGGLDALFADNPNVFVAGDLLWYPVVGEPTIRTAPDVLVVFGRPKGDRGSYRQWEEDNIPPQVVWEILSPGNRGAVLTRKFSFYERYGVEEYYTYDPDTGELSGWQRVGDLLQEISNMRGWVSPRLGVRFEIEDGELALYRPDGRRFVTFTEFSQQRDQAQALAEQEQQRAEAAEAAAARLRALVEQLQKRAGQP